MGFTRSTTDVNVHRNMPDYPSGEGYTTEQLKTAFDSSAAGLKNDLNGLMTELENTDSAGNLGAAPIFEQDESNATVQGKLEYLMSEIQGIALGDIPDGTITKAKMDSTYAGTLAEKDGTLQTGLSAEMLNGKTEAQLLSAFFTTPNATTVNFAEQTAQGTITETKTVSTANSRYFVFTMGGNYDYYRVALYDSQSNKFVFALKIANDNNRLSVGSSSLIVTFAGSTPYASTLTVSHSANVLTLNVTKKSNGSVLQKSGSITVYELGGKI